MADIHPTAVVDPGAVLEGDVVIGPYAVVGDKVTIGEGTRVGAHAVISGETTIGKNNRIHSFSMVGGVPQDLKHNGDLTRLTLGDGNVVREFATIHTGTLDGGGETRIGNDNFFMAYSHVAHDCRIGNKVVMANCATLAGHVAVGDFAVLGGLSGVHQFARIGESSFVAAGAMVSLDVPPFSRVGGDRAKLLGVNALGLKRRGISAETVAVIKRAIRLIFKEDTALADGLELAEAELGETPEVARLIEFVRASSRGCCR
ncbi:MAG: acyl-ACP--UDP-N-acetylglucosamine O-acyltransferase [Deltaproteobacteria bacterium]|nr:acyl-ACP--UDP-N-acetylglucosamine O-acyltransferase [Deltaproteobacteria bacterium]